MSRFSLRGVVAAAAALAASAIVGGYLGAVLSLRLRPILVRWIVIAIGFGLAGYFFWHQYHSW